MRHLKKFFNYLREDTLDELDIRNLREMLIFRLNRYEIDYAEINYLCRYTIHGLNSINSYPLFDKFKKIYVNEKDLQEDILDKTKDVDIMFRVEFDKKEPMDILDECFEFLYKIGFTKEIESDRWSVERIVLKKRVSSSINESIISSDDIDLIEDCFLEFCDKYDEDIRVDKGYLVNGGYIDDRMIYDLIKLAEEEDKKIHPIKVYKVVMFRKSFRNHDLQDQSSIWKEEINKDYKSCIKRVERMSKLKSTQVINEISPTAWQICTYFEY